MEDTRQHILNTSVNLFLKKSFHEVTMNDIVTASGMSKGAFYHYFSSKEKVFEEVVNHFFPESKQDEFSQLSQESLWSFCHDYVDMIIKRVNHYSQTTGGEAGEMRANQLNLVADATKMLPEFHKKQQLRQQQELSAWVRIIGKARQAGEISSKLTDEQIAKLFTYLYYGIGMSYLLQVQLTEFIREVTRTYEALYQTLKT